MNDLEHIAGLDAIQAEINRLSLQAFERLTRLIDDGKAPRDAIAEVQTAFVGDYEAGLLQAFNRILVTSIGTAELRQLKIGDLTLSDRLYQHSRDVSATVINTINNHAKGFHDSRKLALQLYEGYGFRQKEPLDVRVPLPKYFRAAFGDDEAFKALWKNQYVGSKLAGLAEYVETGPELARLYANIQASNLKTPALKAAYLGALQALENGQGKQVLSKLLKTAFYERNRYFANRIAQTELHRAYTAQVAAEIMADDGIQYVEYRMSQTHPKLDICDLFARMDKYGLGPGVYPKAHAPKPPLHPSCRCKTSPRAWVDGSQRLRPAAERNFLTSLPTHEARQIMGSADRLAQVRAGKSVDDVLNAGRAEMYHLKRLGEFGKLKALPDLGKSAGDEKPWPLFGPEDVITNQQMKELGKAIFDELLDKTTPNDRKLFASMSSRGKLIRDLVQDADTTGVPVDHDVAMWLRSEILAKLRSVRSVGNVAPSLYQKSGKAVTIMRRVASKLPDEWITKGNEAGRLHVSVSKARGYFNGRKWDKSALEFRRFISTTEGSTAEHEFMHHIQFADKNLDRLFVDEHRQRTYKDALEVLYSHTPNETGKPDGYVERYQGREYGAKPLEVITMAFQAVIGEDYDANDYLARTLQKDKEMLYLTLGTLFHYKP